MEFLVFITPVGEEENEYATPCLFRFDRLHDATDFANFAMRHAEVVVEIKKIQA